MRSKTEKKTFDENRLITPGDRQIEIQEYEDKCQKRKALPMTLVVEFYETVIQTRAVEIKRDAQSMNYLYNYVPLKSSFKLHRKVTANVIHSLSTKLQS